MTPGERLKYVRKKRGFTMKFLGMFMGYPEESADVRIAQYEANKRGLTKKVAAKFASALNVSPSNFTTHICETPEEFYRSMVWIAEEYGSSVVEQCYWKWSHNQMDVFTGFMDEDFGFDKDF